MLDQTIDSIHHASPAAGASPHLANAAKVAWSKSVAAQYFRELAAEPLHGPVIEMPDDYVGRPTLVMTGPPSSGPITSPSQVSAPEVVTTPAPTVTASPVTVALPVTPAVAPASPPVIAVAPTPSGLGQPINPYDDCACST